MWLLNTADARVKFFSEPSDVPDGYAIVSHIHSNGDSDWSLKKVQDHNRQCDQDNIIPLESDKLLLKIRKSCSTAAEYGLQWVWIDLACLNRSSSSELSEEINSVFLWFSHSEVCFALLDDVLHAEEDPAADGSEFRSAMWHTRGWTLQELLSPLNVIFMTRDWTPIGTKRELCSVLRQVTGIEEDYLTHKKSIFSASVATRMSWASERNTSREEDEAYSLLGIFGVQMTAIYGEGRRAFQRLQEEIIKQGPDTSLFAWGPCPSDEYRIPKAPANPYERMADEQPPLPDVDEIPLPHESFLLASSPQDFAKSRITFTPALRRVCQPYLPHHRQVKPESPLSDAFVKESSPSKVCDRTFGPFGSIEYPSVEVVAQGIVKCHLPVIEVDTLTIALLLCEKEPDLTNGTDRAHLGLLLHPAPDHTVPHPTGKQPYYTGCSIIGSTSRPEYYRLVSLGRDLHNLEFGGVKLKAHWQDIYIQSGPTQVHRDPYRLLKPPTFDLPSTPPFRIPISLMSKMRRSLGFTATSCWDTAPNTASAGDPTWLEFQNDSRGERIRLRFGNCSHSRQTRHWAWAELTTAWYPEPEDESDSWRLRKHDCDTDWHVTYTERPNADTNTTLDNVPDKDRGLFKSGSGDRNVQLCFRQARDYDYSSSQIPILSFKLLNHAGEEIKNGGVRPIPPNSPDVPTITLSPAQGENPEPRPLSSAPPESSMLPPYTYSLAPPQWPPFHPTLSQSRLSSPSYSPSATPLPLFVPSPFPQLSVSAPSLSPSPSISSSVQIPSGFSASPLIVFPSSHTPSPSPYSPPTQLPHAPIQSSPSQPVYLLSQTPTASQPLPAVSHHPVPAAAHHPVPAASHHPTPAASHHPIPFSSHSKPPYTPSIPPSPLEPVIQPCEPYIPPHRHPPSLNSNTSAIRWPIFAGLRRRLASMTRRPDTVRVH